MKKQLQWAHCSIGWKHILAYSPPHPIRTAYGRMNKLMNIAILLMGRTSIPPPPCPVLLAVSNDVYPAVPLTTPSILLPLLLVVIVRYKSHAVTRGIVEWKCHKLLQMARPGRQCDTTTCATWWPHRAYLTDFSQFLQKPWTLRKYVEWGRVRRQRLSHVPRTVIVPPRSTKPSNQTFPSDKCKNIETIRSLADRRKTVWPVV